MSEQSQINQSIFDNVNIGGSLKTGDILKIFTFNQNNYKETLLNYLNAVRVDCLDGKRN